MDTPRIDLAWWPPAPDEPLGEPRAQELAAQLPRCTAPAIDAARAALRDRVGPGARVVDRLAPLGYLARAHLDPETFALWIGVVYAPDAEDIPGYHLYLHGDGAIQWHPN